MYTVFVVEDEIVVREGIRDNIKWEFTNFIFSGEAPDGEIALPMIQEIKPDILVTDIKMPFMDGLQLSKIISKNMPWIKIIILSGHDEFQFAREAISIGVTEYLLKPINSTDLIEALNKVALQIENEKKARESTEELKKQLEIDRTLFRDKFLNELTFGMISGADVIDKCLSFGIKIISKFYLVEIIEMRLKEEQGIYRNYSKLANAESLICSTIKDNQNIIQFKRNMEEIVLILSGNNASVLVEFGYNIAQSIKCEVERNTDYTLTIGIGSVNERIQGISQSFKDADTARNYKYLFGKNKIIGINDIKIKIANKEEFLKFDNLKLLDLLKCGNKSDGDKIIMNYMRGLNESAMGSLIYAYYALIDIIMMTSKFIEELGGDFQEVIPEINQLENIMVDLGSVSDFQELARKILVRVYNYRDSRIENKYGAIIYNAKEYIKNNFSDPNISLNSVAFKVNVSPSHFSTIFRQETGETFIEYLIKMRIKKAKELLKITTQKSSEIAYSIGYTDPHYFSYTFKKTTGLTPNEFRSTC